MQPTCFAPGSATKRLLSLTSKLSEQDFAGGDKNGLIRTAGWEVKAMANAVFTLPLPGEVEQQATLWDTIHSALGDVEVRLCKLHSAKARLFTLQRIHEATTLRHNNWTARKLRNWFKRVTERQKLAAPILNVMQDGQLVSEPGALSGLLVDYFEDWFGKSQKIWYRNANGGLHPIAQDNERGFTLREAFVNGTYDEVAGEGEELPACAARFKTAGQYKIATKGQFTGHRIQPMQVKKMTAAYMTSETDAVRSRMNMTKRPGVSGVSKRSLFYAADEFWDAVVKMMNLSKSTGHFYSAFQEAEVILLDKVETDPRLKNKRPIWMLETIMKAMNQMDEHRLQQWLSKQGIEAINQYGFTRGKCIKTPTFITMQMIEQARIARRPLRVLFKDFHHAFDMVDGVVGKTLAEMRFGIPQAIALQQRRADESIAGDIVVAAGKSSDICDRKVTRKTGNCQGEPRAAPKWGRCLDVLAAAHEEPHEGTPAVYTDEEGCSHPYWGHYYADDPVYFCGDELNAEARRDTDERWSHFSGVPESAHKGSYMLIDFDEGGQMLEEFEHDLQSTNCQTGEVSSIPHLGPHDKFRNLGWFSSASLRNDHAYDEVYKECESELRILSRKSLTADEFSGIINTCTIARVRFRLGYATTGPESVRRMQRGYKKKLKRLASLPDSFPNNLIFGSHIRGGVGISNFYDEVMVERICLFLQHARGNGSEQLLAAAAVKQSEMLTQGGTPVLERTKEAVWDGTWLGRIAQFCTQTKWSIVGGQENHGHRENDIAIASLDFHNNHESAISAGCRHYDLHWVSQLLTEDGYTWRTEFQDHREFFSGSYVYQASLSAPT